jgi:hypothetical protein
MLTVTVGVWLLLAAHGFTSHSLALPAAAAGSPWSTLHLTGLPAACLPACLLLLVLRPAQPPPTWMMGA